MNEAIPPRGRLAGIDYGTVRVGVSLCDEGRILASPHETYHRADEASDAAYFQKLVESESVVGFVVGLPLHNSGDESQKSFEARNYGRWLHELTRLPVVFVDERFSSAVAESWLGEAQLTKKKRKSRVDKIAAQVILSSYLESPGNCQPLPLDD